MSVPRDVDEYLGGVPDDARRTLDSLREAIKAAAPQAAEGISYQIPTYKLDGHLVACAAWKNHCGFYVMSEPVMEAHRADLEPYKTEKATIHFPIGDRVPAQVVKTIVEARIAENAAVKAERSQRQAGKREEGRDQA